MLRISMSVLSLCAFFPVVAMSAEDDSHWYEDLIIPHKRTRTHFLQTTEFMNVVSSDRYWYQRDNYEAVRSQAVDAVLCGEDPHIFLRAAVEKDDYQLMEFLILSGASVRKKVNFDAQSKTMYGDKLILYARSASIAHLLVQHGANTPLVGDDGGVVHAAMRPEMSVDLLTYYLQRMECDGIDINQLKTPYDYTPLHALMRWGISYGHVRDAILQTRQKLIELLRYDMRLDHVDYQGKTALDIWNEGLPYIKEHYPEYAELYTHISILLGSALSDCPICYEPFGFGSARDVCVVSCCNHIFHAGCLNGWRKYSPENICPACRQKITSWMSV